MMFVNVREFVGVSLFRNVVEDIECGLYCLVDKQC